jgi:hypothetical protein
MLAQALATAGYVHSSLEGVRIKPIELDNGRWGAPYFDGGITNLEWDGDYMKLVVNGEFRNPEHCVCLINDMNSFCPCCEEHYRESDMIHVTHENRDVCETCFNEYYILAHTPEGEYYVNTDDTVFCESNAETYVYNTEFLEEREIVRSTYDGCWYEKEDIAQLVNSGGNIQTISNHYAECYPDQFIPIVPGLFIYRATIDVPAVHRAIDATELLPCPASDIAILRDEDTNYITEVQLPLADETQAEVA